MPREFSRKSRVNAELHRELAALIRSELTDPRVALVTVTHVDMSPDLRNARVLVSLLGDDATLAIAVKALNHASGKLRHGIGKRLKLRLVPMLHFAADTQLREADRVSALIKAAVSRDTEVHASDPAPEDPAG